ncbi:MAG: Glutamate synthase [NADPH] small chain [Alphaproteobacteria bacterium MarineAlpha3_Bin5]|nr:dihydropyrimidine dehydrogenase [Magnetovibrio sp.]PPR79606.1 MAG: Glutamate synthase [NADPH] small chain [Alphaproteobacteria bacterium MarineAlpha3_Bin5]
MDVMQQFLNIPYSMPEKRCKAERSNDFTEIYKKFPLDKATGQASRCEQCGIPFCQIHCPLNNNIPDWLRFVAEGRIEEAYRISQATNTFPEICGRICPQDRLCEGTCVLEQSNHKTVTIGAIESYITDTAWEQGWVKGPLPVSDYAQSVGIIGAGPAGLAAADKLRAYGFKVHVYDRQDRMGGLLIYGIPNFKLEKEIVEKRTNLLEASGVNFNKNTEVGDEISFSELRERHDAVLIATGVYKAREILIPGVNQEGIYPAMDYLKASNRKGLGDSVEEFDSGNMNAYGKDVIVVGGGDTAMDCVRTAVRQGASSVKCVYRRDRENMPGSRREVAHAEEEGVKFIWLSEPEVFHGKASVNAIQLHKMHLGIPDVTGRQTPKKLPGTKSTLKADMVITALGFEPEDIPMLFGEPRLATTHWGTIKVQEPYKMTSIPGVFAAGDIMRGASLVVWAIRDGRDAADEIFQYLKPDDAKLNEQGLGLTK